MKTGLLGMLQLCDVLRCPNSERQDVEVCVCVQGVSCRKSLMYITQLELQESGH